MAPKKKKESASASIDPIVASLQKIKNTGRATREEGEPLLNNQPQLIEVNTNDVVDGLAAARLTPAGEARLAGALNVVTQASSSGMVASAFAIIDNAIPPESKRGFAKGGTKAEKYPFSLLEVGKSFFVPVSAELENPLKALGSTVSNANNKYRTDTGNKQEVTRTKRGDGNKAMLDAAGNKIKENKQVPVYKQDRKFVIRGVKKGIAYGGWTAPDDGALITRTI